MNRLVEPAQMAAIAQLKALGFTVYAEESVVVRMRRGSDCRVVMPDGTQKRAQGARK